MTPAPAQTVEQPDRRTRWAVPHQQATEWAMTDTDIRGLPVGRAHRLTPNSALHDLMLRVMDEDAVGFTLSHAIPGRPPMLNLGIDVGTSSLMTKSGGFPDINIPAALDTLETTAPCPLTSTEAVMLGLRADPCPVGVATGSAYADLCVRDMRVNAPCSDGEDCAGDVVRWRVSWHTNREWLTASLPYPLRLLAEPSLAPSRAPEPFLPDR